MNKKKLSFVFSFFAVICFASCTFIKELWGNSFDSMAPVDQLKCDFTEFSLNDTNLYTMRICMRSDVYNSTFVTPTGTEKNLEEISIPSYYSFNPFCERESQQHDEVIEENTLCFVGFSPSNMVTGTQGECIYMTNIRYQGDKSLKKFMTDDSTFYINPVERMLFGQWRVEPVLVNGIKQPRLIVKFRAWDQTDVKWLLKVENENGYTAIKIESISSPKADKLNKYQGENQIILDNVLDYSNPYTKNCVTLNENNSNGLRLYQHRQTWKPSCRLEAIKDKDPDLDSLSSVLLYKKEGKFTVQLKDEKGRCYNYLNGFRVCDSFPLHEGITSFSN